MLVVTSSFLTVALGIPSNNAPYRSGNYNLPRMPSDPDNEVVAVEEAFPVRFLFVPQDNTL